jgi:starch-binding outer membrane protein, SusD/RagB family
MNQDKMTLVRPARNSFLRRGFQGLLVIVLISLTSCNDYLEHLPDQRTELNTPEKISELVASAYPQANYITFLEAMTDNAEDKGITETDIINREPWYFNDVPNRDVDTPDFYWHAAYEAIASANQALEAIENTSDPSLLLSTKGEALVARAYSHFMLVTLYCKIYDPNSAEVSPGIPYVTDVEKEVVKKYERKTVAYVYEQIEKDLMKGIPLINNSAYDDKAPKYHFTTSAAHAFATRFYLFKKDYQKVVEHANQVFPNGDALPFLRPINSIAYRSMEPFVKLAEYTKATQPSNLLLVEAPSVWSRNLRGYRYGFTYRLLENIVWGENPTNGLWSYMFYGTAEALVTPKFREHFVKQDPNANIGDPYNMIPLLTAEEVLFNRAEANIRLGKFDEAIKDLNDFASQRIVVSDQNPNYDPAVHTLNIQRVRDFYQNFDLESALISTVLDFKRVEFLYEGMRWFDIIRHDLPVVHTTIDKATVITIGPNDPRRILQIPQEAQSAGLELNPR